MLMKRPTYRRFEYIPRFYNPDKDEQERRKRKLGFRNYRRFDRRKGVNKIIIWAIAIIIIAWFISKYSN
ncbi:MAG: hypothetical protein NZM09_09765 [Ignavibacterium sp.]|nr:hypothetical protein [Ignavibacterium sp.]MDW8375964.1 hypothetical protein [Ignavibacteriales bacterium]